MKYIVLFLSFMFLLIAAGCNDLLDQNDREDLSEESFWQNASDARKGIIAAYAALTAYDGSKWTFFEENFVAVTYKADDIVNNPAESYGKGLAGYTYGTDESSFLNLWKTRYTGIFYANQVLKNVPGIDMSASEKSEILAEARFLRAFNHFSLLTMFQNIPLITEVPENVDDFYPSQAAPQDVWAQIEADLQAAISDLPDDYDAANQGRATKYTAMAYLGKVYLYQEKWDLAAAQFEKVVASGAYGLLPNYEDNFTGQFENGPESVFELQFTSDRSNANDERHPFNFEVTSYALGGWELLYPSDWLVEQFLKDTLSDGSFSDRAYASIFFDDPHGQSTAWTTDGELKNYNDVRDQFGDQKTFFKKYAYFGDINFYSGLNVDLMRYADVLLMYAEALNEQGNTGGAIANVNQVRNRSNLPDLPAMGQDELRQHIRHFERPVELSMEWGIRWNDLARWNRGNAAKESIGQTLMDHRKPFAENFTTGRHEIYPIPLSEMNKNANLKQNPGW